MNVSRSGYYYWLADRPSKRTTENESLLELIKASFTASKGRYGSPRITQDLIGQGHTISRPRVARLMQKAQIKSIIQKEYVVTTTDSNRAYPVADNHLDRNFNPPQPGKAWVSDLTYIRTREGWLYLTIIMDLFNRQVIGWALSESMKASQISVAAWKMDITNRPIADKLLFHRSGDPVRSRSSVRL